MYVRRAMSASACLPQALRNFHSSRVSNRIYNNVLETIGETPVVKLNRIAPEGINMYAKLEYFNPLSSVKDRLAIAAIEDAERRGVLKPGMTVVEATSGNTGISLAMVCAAKGYNLVITMAESFSVERRKVMRMLGAKVVLTPAPLKGTGMVLKARELAEKNGWFSTAQFENPANPAYHANTTGPEILRDFVGKPLDYYVTGYGTGGTFHGVAKILRTARPETKIVLSEPAGAPLVSSGIGQERLGDGSPAATHPAFTPHPIQGWTPDFIPKILEEALDQHLYDTLIQIEAEPSMECARNLAKLEGIFTGVSGGATVLTALEVAKTAPPGSTILAMVPDTAERYLSTPLFGAIAAEMDEEEVALSLSTPASQMEKEEG